MKNGKHLSLANMTAVLFAGIATLPVLAISAAVIFTLRSASEKGLVELSLLSNTMADRAIEASAEYAKERGFTGVLLSQPALNPNLAAKVKSFREKGDAGFKESLEAMKKITKSDPSNQLLAPAIDELEKSRKALEELRSKVDTNAYGTPQALQPKEFIVTITKYIDALNHARVSAFRAKSVHEQTLVNNLRLKHLLWLASEYAGRERGNVGPIVATKTPMSDELLSNVAAWNGMIERSLSEVLAMKGSGGMAPEVVKAMDGIEREYIGRFKKVKAEVYQAAKTGAYALTGDQWLEESTTAINAILKAATAISDETALTLSREAGEIDRRVRTYNVLLIAFALFSIVAVIVGFLVRRKTLANVGTTIKNLDGESSSLQNMSHQLWEVSASIEDAAKEQSSAVHETMASIEEMTSTISQTAKNAAESHLFAHEVEMQCQESNESIQKLMVSMEGIQAANAQLGEITDLMKQISGKTSAINDIVFKTQLLSFNASIEAAHAGTQGRGFSIVAQEVGNLAHRSGEAAQQIQSILDASMERVATLLGQVQGRIDDASKSSERACIAFGNISDRMSSITRQIEQIKGVTQEQDKAMKEVSLAMARLERTVVQSQKTVEHILKTSSLLQTKSSDLMSVAADTRSSVMGAEGTPVLAN